MRQAFDKGKPIVARSEANRDVDEVIDHYLSENAEQACVQIARHPATGSPCYAHELNIPGLRSWPLNRYPYLVFFVEREDRIDVWRVLPGQRDIPAWLDAESDGKH